MIDANCISDFLRPRLTKGTRVHVYHISTAPTSCPPLYAPGPGQPTEPTTLESHFLALSQADPRAENATDSPSDIIVLGVEILIFATKSLTTVFVSKADSTGFLTKSSETHVRSASLAQTAITSFLDYLLLPRLPHTRVVLSLFARSQSQYLFPGSIENATKHVLDDRQLIKWWCRVLDPLIRQGQTEHASTVRAYVVVPGCDKAETRAFFPASARSDPISTPIWLNAYPVDLLVDDTSLPPRCLVPRLPDDPKARFLDDLDDHGINNGHWRNVKTLDQFWEMMSYRQECSAGRLVGFVWVIFSPNASARKPGGISSEVSVEDQPHHPNRTQAESETRPAIEATDGSIMPRTCTQDTPVETSGSANPITPKAVALATVQDEFNIIAASVQASIGGGGGEASHTTNHVHPTDCATAVDIAQHSQHHSKEAARLSADGYQESMDVLLHLDFAGTETAQQSTRTWREKVETLAGLSHFGTYIEGEKEVEQRHDAASQPQDTVNMLTAVRKKRKVQADETLEVDPAKERPSVNTLATNLVRKKAKS